MKTKKIILILCLSFMLSSGLAKAENWDMPTSYTDTIFHTQNIKQFAEDVSKTTDGKLTINVTPAVEGSADIANNLTVGLTQIGEVYLPALVADHAIFRNNLAGLNVAESTEFTEGVIMLNQYSQFSPSNR